MPVNPSKINGERIEIKSTNYMLFASVVVAMMLLLHKSAEAGTQPELTTHEEEVYSNELHIGSQSIQISEAQCLRLLEKIEMDEDLSEKAIAVLMSSNTVTRKRVLLLCSAYYDDAKLLVRRLTQLFSISRHGNQPCDYSMSGMCINAEGKQVFDTLPVGRTNWSQNGNGNSVAFDMGDFIDVNGDGMADYVISWMEIGSNCFYKATFINSGNGWIMDSCHTNCSYTKERFPPCQ